MARIFQALILAALIYCGYLATVDEGKLPPLKDGDLLFQTTWTNQSTAIALASNSLYLHAGIVKTTKKGPVVVQAGLKVIETPLTEWVDQGILRRFSVYRYRDLTPAQAEAVLKAAQSYKGRPYDFYFTFGKDAIYCSELLYVAYKDAGVPLGQPEKIGELNINNRFVKGIIEQRWQKYPACQTKGMTFEQCYGKIMEGDIITPARVAEDPHLERIFSNYPLN